MNLPVPPSNLRRSQTSPALRTFAVSLWSLLVAGTLAGLLYTVGLGSQRDANDRRHRQKADALLAPLLAIQDDFGAPQRQQQLLEALKIIQTEVLTLDPAHPIAHTTAKLLEEELRQLQDIALRERDLALKERERQLELLRLQASRAQNPAPARTLPPGSTNPPANTGTPPPQQGTQPQPQPSAPPSRLEGFLQTAQQIRQLASTLRDN